MIRIKEIERWLRYTLQILNSQNPFCSTESKAVASINGFDLQYKKDKGVLQIWGYKSSICRHMQHGINRNWQDISLKPQEENKKLADLLASS